MVHFSPPLTSPKKSTTQCILSAREIVTGRLLALPQAGGWWMFGVRLGTCQGQLSASVHKLQEGEELPTRSPGSRQALVVDKHGVFDSAADPSCPAKVATEVPKSAWVRWLSLLHQHISGDKRPGACLHCWLSQSPPTPRLRLLTPVSQSHSCCEPGCTTLPLNDTCHTHPSHLR